MKNERGASVGSWLQRYLLIMRWSIDDGWETALWTHKPKAMSVSSLSPTMQISRGAMPNVSQMCESMNVEGLPTCAHHPRLKVTAGQSDVQLKGCGADHSGLDLRGGRDGRDHRPTTRPCLRRCQVCPAPTCSRRLSLLSAPGPILDRCVRWQRTGALTQRRDLWR